MYSNGYRQRCRTKFRLNYGNNNNSNSNYISYIILCQLVGEYEKMKNIIEQLKDEEMLDDSIINSYYVLTGKATIDDIIERQEFPMFFVNPEDELDEDTLEDMLDYFISTEEYEKCQELVELLK